jgi:hypothetical protein
MNGAQTLFGVNFADGRIKGYGYSHPGRGRPEKKFYARYVRNTTDQAYGENDFADNGDGTVTDRVTGMMWMKADSGQAMTWEEALAWAENLEYGGYDDWRLPNAKELQYIVDYSRSPDTTGIRRPSTRCSIHPCHHQRGGAERLPLLLDLHHPPGRPGNRQGGGLCGFRPRPGKDAGPYHGCSRRRRPAQRSQNRATPSGAVHRGTPYGC